MGRHRPQRKSSALGEGFFARTGERLEVLRDDIVMHHHSPSVNTIIRISPSPVPGAVTPAIAGARRTVIRGA